MPELRQQSGSASERRDVLLHGNKQYVPERLSREANAGMVYEDDASLEEMLAGTPRYVPDS